MMRKAVTRRLQAIASLRRVIRMSGDSLSERLAQRPAAPRGVGLGYGAVFEHWDADLASVERQLASAEEAYVRAKDRLAGVRGLRDEANLSLYQKQTTIQGVLQGVLGSSELALEGIAGAVPQDVARLALRVRQTVALLRCLQQGGRWPADKVGIEVPDLIEPLDASGSRLGELVSELEDARVDVDMAKCRADAAVEGADGVVPWITRALESLCRLAGEDVLAGRIRAR